ncbi:phosphatidate cytidyltransferase [Bartonella clarridgeiae 73]|uniref:Phosphatidate cytidyltransferase n=1 Tax=Bartonella clarridgeiae (strain CCUG 45776 / CIP 104772 / 73) TaxID=696125 RepID=E6YI64_BARC7|nr:UDP-2,3-diacylglucosamine diphosphatase LpxI [Bartonella clarridgeiae]WCR54876.1 MAG: UDP-2 3-diacylglucosamine pyrophosphatase [Bartonella clarridgeiae]CBI76552.1 phosphatidate cytidyltransferase [Bartonella clarridgeiae 73]
MPRSFLSGRTAIIAGNGVLPIVVAQELEKRGQNPFIVLLRGEADVALYSYQHCELSIVELARLFKVLKATEIHNVILAGGVKKRPSLLQLRPDWTTLSALSKLFKALRSGDDTLLKAFIRVVEDRGFCVVGAHEVVPDLLAPIECNLTLQSATPKQSADILLAIEAARLLGRLDIGQAAVAIDGRVVAVEDSKGTDNMLKRVQEIRERQHLPQGGVLVKCAKPQQDYRVDLPSIGPTTVINVAKSGLSGIAVEAKKSLILSLEKTIEEANKHSLFIETFRTTDNE